MVVGVALTCGTHHMIRGIPNRVQHGFYKHDNWECHTLPIIRQTIKHQ